MLKQRKKQLYLKNLRKHSKKQSFLMKNNEIYYTQDSFANLYKITQETISEHIRNIYKDKELVKSKTEVNLTSTSKTIISQNELKKQCKGKYPVFYKHSMFNAIGFRINSENAIKFRIEVNKLLESIRTGKTKLVSNKFVENLVNSQKTTKYRFKMNEWLCHEK